MKVVGLVAARMSRSEGGRRVRSDDRESGTATGEVDWTERGHSRKTTLPTYLLWRSRRGGRINCQWSSPVPRDWPDKSPSGSRRVKAGAGGELVRLKVSGRGRRSDASLFDRCGLSRPPGGKQVGAVG